MTQLGDQVLDHLEDERKAIAQGAFDTLAGLGATKEALFGQIATSSLPPEILTVIGQRAKRNLRLLDAALRGVKDASDRLRDQRAVKAGFETYGADGQRTAHPAKRSGFEHKA